MTFTLPFTLIQMGYLKLIIVFGCCLMHSRALQGDGECLMCSNSLRGIVIKFELWILNSFYVAQPRLFNGNFHALFFSESDVHFTSNPIIHTTLTTTNITGCSYKSARNESLHQYSYIATNGTLYKINDLTTSSGESDGEGRFTFPSVTFPYKMQQSVTTCVIVLGIDRYQSNATMVYNQPGMTEYKRIDPFFAL